MTSYRPLSTVVNGQTVRVQRITAGRGLQARLAAMGVLPGAELRVVSNRFSGPCIVAVWNTRVVLGRGMAHKVLVE